MGIIEWLR
ncbi:tonB-dependent Receptor Plug domain protein, partial [Yersinia pestis PY-52]